MKKIGFVAASIALIASAPAVSHSQASPRVYTAQNPERGNSNNDVPEVRVWLENASFRTGDLIRPRIQADDDAYLTVFRVTTDGEIKILYPSNPLGQEASYSGMFSNDLIPVKATENGTSSFYVRESTGNGFIFAVASHYRFNFNYYAPKGKWSLARLASASRFGSPFQIVRSFVEEITDGSSSYSMDYVMYDVNANQYYTRYASRYQSYAYDDYYDLCLNAFGSYYTGYCRGYYGGYYYPGVVVVSRPNGEPLNPPGSRRQMTKPLVVDPVFPNVPREPVPVDGRVAPNDNADREAAAIARRERALRDAKPRIDPMQAPMQAPRRADPEPQVFRTQTPVIRPEPRMDAPRPQPRTEAPRMDAPRPMPSAPARVEVRNEPPRQAAPPPPPPTPPKQVEKPQKDNSN